jgi:hypothetical protein
MLPNSLRAVLRRSSDRHCESVNSLYLHTLLLSLTAWHCLYSHEGIDSTHNSDHSWHIQVNYPPADRPPAIAAGVILFFLQLKGVRRPRARARVCLLRRPPLSVHCPASQSACAHTVRCTVWVCGMCCAPVQYTRSTQARPVLTGSPGIPHRCGASRRSAFRRRTSAQQYPSILWTTPVRPTVPKHTVDHSRPPNGTQAYCGPLPSAQRYPSILWTTVYR